MATRKTPTHKTAMVTGASVRLGRAIALHLASRGYDLVLHCGTRRREALALARTIERQGVRAHVVQADLTRPNELAAMFQSIDGFTRRLSVLVNSASAFEKAPFLALSDTQIAHMIAANLTGPMIVARHAAARMAARQTPGAQNSGLIINMLDIGGAVQPWSGFSHYCAAKAGLAMLTRVLAVELAPQIRVNGIAPGTVFPPAHYSPAACAALAEAIPLRRLGRPADVLRAFDYLLDAPFVTGAIEVVDGGRSQGPGGGREVS